MRAVDGVSAEYDAVAGCACALCAAAPPLAEQTARAQSATTAPGDGAFGEAVSGLLSGVKWAGTTLTYSFPDAASDYAYRGYLSVRDTFQPATDALASAARAGFEFYASVSGLSFTELTGAADRDADLMIGRSAAPGTAFAYYPFSGDEGGDAWFNLRDYNAPVAGDYAWATVLHEIGHALGLKHGHETGGGGALPFALDSHEYSLMTYRSYVGASGAYYTNGATSGPQTPMMLDIAAVQRLYGANYDFRAGDDVYAFTPGSGRMSVNGVLQEATAGAVIFRTIWDGGGTDTYDFSAYASALSIDLAPGGFVDLDVGGLAQRAYLGGGVHARGHVFNALEHQGDARSLIENAVGGAGADLILGNRAANRLDGRAGDDTLEGFGGADTLVGGAGADVFRFDLSEADGAADLILDLDFAEGDRIELFGLAAAGLSAAALAAAGVETFAGGSAARLRGADDLLALESAALATLGEAFGGAAALTLSAGAASRTIILGSVALADLHPASAAAADAPAQEAPAPLLDPLALTGEAPPTELPGEEVTITVRRDEPTDRLTEVTTDEPPGLPETDGRTPATPARIIGAAQDETLRGGAAAEFLAGRGGDDMLMGGGGDDTLKGQAGSDRLLGGAGDDSLAGGGAADRLQGGAGDDFLRGQGGDDMLRGGAGDDTIAGGAGADRIFGEGGDDILTGGAGGDLFVFSGRFGDDEITDFAAGVDRISLGALAPDFAALDIAAAGEDAVIRLAAGTITLRGVAPDALDAGDFLF